MTAPWPLAKALLHPWPHKASLSAAVRKPDGGDLAIEPVGRRLSRRRVDETAPASDMNCDEPAVARDSTARQCSRPPSEDTGPNTAQPHTSSMLPLELSDVPSTRIEGCLARLAGHTHIDPAQTIAALCSLLRPAAPYAAVRRHAPSRPPLSPGQQARQQVVDPSAATAVGAQEQEREGGPAGTAALSAITRPRQPTLRLLSLNVNGLQDKVKRRWLFNLLERDNWDVILLQETHHRSPEEGGAWAQEN
ncbi:g8833 [Coccomyxa elongata]